MILVALVTSIISVIGVIGAAIFTYTTNRKAQGLTERDMNWQWAMKRIELLEADKKDLQARATNAERRMNEMQARLDQSEDTRRQQEVQIALLERLVDGHPSP